MKIIIGVFAVLFVGVVIFCLISSRPAFRVGDRVQVALEWRTVPMADGSPNNDPDRMRNSGVGATLGDFAA